MELKLNNDKNKEVIAKVLKWLNSAKVVGNANDQFMSFGSSPTIIILKFQTGEVISITDAIGTSAPIKLGNGTQIHSIEIPNQVTVIRKHELRRIEAPELKRWIQGGWSNDILILKKILARSN